MTVQQREPAADGGSIVRSVLVTVGAVALAAMGQWLSAFVMGAAGAGAVLLAHVHRTERGDQPAPADPQGATTSAPSQTTRTAQRDHVEVERRPRNQSGGQTQKQNTNADNEKKKSASPLPFGLFSSFFAKHPFLTELIEKLGKDNIGMLAAFISWSLLTSMVPIIVGLIAISGLVLGLFLHDPSTQHQVVSHLASATQNAFSTKEINAIVKGSQQHAGLLGLIGFVGVLWGGSSVGGSISTVFQAVFEVEGRSFIKEKLIDVGMIFVFTALMLVIIAGSSAAAILTGLFSVLSTPWVAQAIGIAIDVAAAFILFGVIYLVFPNIKPRFRLGNVWKGALASAILFTILSQVWGIYAQLEHFGKYGKLLSTILILTAWIYFFSMILVFGSEIVAVGAIREAKKQDTSVGPQTNDTVPQHKVLRDQPVG